MGFPGGSAGKESACMRETWIWSYIYGFVHIYMTFIYFLFVSLQCSYFIWQYYASFFSSLTPNPSQLFLVYIIHCNEQYTIVWTDYIILKHTLIVIESLFWKYKQYKNNKIWLYMLLYFSVFISRKRFPRMALLGECALKTMKSLTGFFNGVKIHFAHSRVSFFTVLLSEISFHLIK